MGKLSIFFSPFTADYQRRTAARDAHFTSVAPATATRHIVHPTTQIQKHSHRHLPRLGEFFKCSTQAATHPKHLPRAVTSTLTSTSTPSIRPRVTTSVVKHTSQSNVQHTAHVQHVARARTALAPVVGAAIHLVEHCEPGSQHAYNLHIGH